MSTTRRVFNLSGGSVSLNFINTLWRRRAPDRTELLDSYDALLAFAEQAGLISDRDYLDLQGLAQAEPELSDATLTEARTLRETLYRIFSAIAQGDHVAEADLQTIESWAARACSSGSLVSSAGRYDWEFVSSDDLRRPLWPIALKSVELLRSSELGRVRECAAKDCGWMFIDQSRNQSRRWCDMASCGNRAKAARYRQRQATAAD